MLLLHHQCKWSTNLLQGESFKVDGSEHYSIRWTQDHQHANQQMLDLSRLWGFAMIYRFIHLTLYVFISCSLANTHTHTPTHTHSCTHSLYKYTITHTHSHTHSLVSSLYFFCHDFSFVSFQSISTSIPFLSRSIHFWVLPRSHSNPISNNNSITSLYVICIEKWLTLLCFGKLIFNRLSLFKLPFYTENLVIRTIKLHRAKGVKRKLRWSAQMRVPWRPRNFFGPVQADLPKFMTKENYFTSCQIQFKEWAMDLQVVQLNQIGPEQERRCRI